jgi:hypothetical protein
MRRDVRSNAIRGLLLGILATCALAQQSFAAGEDKQATQAGSPNAKLIERGKYLVRIAGCNDCHTPRYVQSGGNIPETEWLTGDRLGFRGAWGTTYPGNLRLYVQNISAEQWVKTAKSTQFRPPMPWFNLRDMTERDLRAMYQFIRSLGPAGEAAPAYVPPGENPQGPVVQFPEPPR